MTPGEESITTAVNSGRGYTYLDNTTLSGAYAQALGAAVVVLERACFQGLHPLTLLLCLGLVVADNTRSLLWRVISVRWLRLADSAISHHGASGSRCRQLCTERHLPLRQGEDQRGIQDSKFFPLSSLPFLRMLTEITAMGLLGSILLGYSW